MPKQEGFLARVYFLKPEEGGRKSPISSGYRPMLYFGLESKGKKLYNDGILFIDDGKQVQPGETCDARVVPLHPELLHVSLQPPLTFDITEGSRVVGRGEILKPT
jgi:elongation factor Tu